jgi:hypothetical protein
MLVYAALGLVLVVSLGAFAYVALRPSLDSSAEWSSWKPASGRLPIVAKSIADHVGPKYKFDSGDQLVAVVPSPPAVTAGTQNVSITAVSMRRTENGKPVDEVRQLGVGESEMYTLCGLGNRCSIATGEPSESRGRLVRREGLELALETFKHVSAVESVLVFMPPAKGATATTALFFERGDLAGRLKLPLEETLPLTTPPPAGQDDPTEGPLIDALTLPHLFVTQLIQLQVGGALLALMPVAF